MSNNETSFDFVCEWFEKASHECMKQGKTDSALLWADGLTHLRVIRSRNERLEEALKECTEVLHTYIYGPIHNSPYPNGINPFVVLGDRKAFKKAQQALKENIK